MHIANTDQAEYWGASPAGWKWIDHEDRMDAALRPVLDLVLSRAALAPGERVLDIGCGTGASTLAAADLVGDAGHVLGADIAAPFLDRARERAAGRANITFTQADAQVAPFDPGARDVLISRFGVMFFDDPAAAFANMGRALRPGGRMVMASWADLPFNPWFEVPFIAAVKRLGKPPKADRNAPGPLAFHDTDRVCGLMTEAGLADVGVDVVDIDLTPMGDPGDVADLLTTIGSATRVVEHFGGTAEDTAAIRETVRDTFAPHQTSKGVRIPARINLYHAGPAS